MHQAAALLAARGFQVEVRSTTRPGEAETLARAAAEAKFDRVIVAAGDGTIGEVVNGLVGSSTALGILPGGTGNVAARNLGVRRLDRALAVAVGDAFHALDVGVANGRCFLTMAGLGFDAEVISRVGPRAKRTLRDLAYFAQALARFPTWPPTRLRLTLDDGPPRDCAAWLLVINNMPKYAWSIALSPAARMDDGQLDLFLCTGLCKWRALRQIAGTLLGLPMLADGVERHQAQRVVVASARPWPLHLDGDPLGTTPVRCTVRPAALRVLMAESG